MNNRFVNQLAGLVLYLAILAGCLFLMAVAILGGLVLSLHVLTLFIDIFGAAV